VRVVRPGQPVEGERLADMDLDPVGARGIFSGPFGEILPVIEPAQFLQAGAVGLAGQVLERIPEKVDITPLPGGIGQDLVPAGRRSCWFRTGQDHSPPAKECQAQQLLREWSAVARSALMM